MGSLTPWGRGPHGVAETGEIPIGADAFAVLCPSIGISPVPATPWSRGPLLTHSCAQRLCRRIGMETTDMTSVACGVCVYGANANTSMHCRVAVGFPLQPLGQVAELHHHAGRSQVRNAVYAVCLAARRQLRENNKLSVQCVLNTKLNEPRMGTNVNSANLAGKTMEVGI